MCVCVCVFANIHEIFVYTYDLTYMALFAKIVVEEDTFFLLQTMVFESEDSNLSLSGKKDNHFLYCYTKQCLVKHRQ